MRTLDDVRDFEMLNVRDVAQMLGIHTDSVYALIQQGTVPSVRLGRKIKVPAFGLKEWLRREASASNGVDSL